jgi:hypothetical protein
VAEEELAELAAFLAEADAPPVTVELPTDPVTLDLPAEPVTADTASPIPAAPRSTSTGYRERDWLVMVRVLGPVDVVNREGVSEELDRSKPLEMLAWSATHRSAATRTRAQDALWSGRAIDPRSVNNVISAGRILLCNLAGEPPEGQWIPLRQEEIDLHPLVVTDMDLLRDRITYARRAGPDEAAAVLAEGLALLRGVPFEGHQWLWADDLSPSMAAEAASAAMELANLRLQAGDVRGALAATDVGLQVIPLHDELTRLSMQAWITDGDRRRALAVYEAYERATAARGEAVAPEVAQLRNELLRAVSPD